MVRRQLNYPILSLHITAKDEAEARLIARTLVEERLAACATIVPAVTSLYHWEGRVAEDTEALLILKTRADLFEAVRERVRALHSYTTPCIVAMPIVESDPDYLNWLLTETRP